ncbi:beta-ribofuranosylaminobenzene 5'-phosphate synthase [Paenibacillus forsythiae]|uniref:Beta-ribofuranosylaminobenzene 5'-phosphate synthase n=1 Tax=Paenibacillus forsythiae TaxID=365616 RepID=A0ABU3HAM3_9BACL|nr:beta-ribofuranosylaminobenzene 5'-phosphate synthase family protein [Paenibacillus forsythiae]MDT3427775.1 beta-ribofuranosylaminobenzene 5'-phosphate synthase [Paenibacillus forsythiae]
MIDTTVKSLKKVSIKTGYRIHINSIDMNGFSGRCCGGLGFALKEPFLELEIEKSDEEIYQCKYPDKVKQYIDKLKEVYSFQSNYYINVVNEISEHIGIGSETQLYYALATGIVSLENAEYDFVDISKKLGLAGVSGIGYGTYTLGKFIVDGGYMLGEEKANFVEHSKKPPVFLFNHEIKSTWKVIVVIPKLHTSISKAEEDAFFAKYTPVPVEEVKEIAYFTLMGVIPAIIESDFQGFIRSMKMITKAGTKRAELKINERICGEILCRLEELFGFSALSSLGPACYTFVEAREDGSLSPFVNERYLTEKFPNCDIYITEIRNAPFEISKSYE